MIRPTARRYLRRIVRLNAVLSLCIVALPRLALAQTQSPSQSAAIPDSPAGRVLSRWLDAFNRGDSAKLAAYEPIRSAVSDLSFRDLTGGFDVQSIEKSEPRRLEFLLKERRSSNTAFGALEITADATPRISEFRFASAGENTRAQDLKIDATLRRSTIDGALAKLDTYYVFPDIAKRLRDTVSARQRRGRYEGFTNGVQLAAALSSDLREVSHDEHMRVGYSAAQLPPYKPGQQPSSEQVEQYKREMAKVNCGFSKVEQLAGNVGYLKLDLFALAEVCGPAASAVLSSVANSDALIIDLRDNGGGDPGMVIYICSYIFSKKTHVNDMFDRRVDSVVQYWTSDTVSGRRLPDDRPIYVLTAPRTFSAAEALAYDLQAQKRATIVGEATRGGAHPFLTDPINEHFLISVPFARAINPITHSSWEGTGVIPDVKVPASDALAAAQKLIAARKQ